jgi:hypothetical protein
MGRENIHHLRSAFFVSGVFAHELTVTGKNAFAVFQQTDAGISKPVKKQAVAIQAKTSAGVHGRPG